MLLDTLNLAVESLKTRFLDTESYDDSTDGVQALISLLTDCGAIKSFLASFLALNGLFALNLNGKQKETFYNCFFKLKLVLTVSFAFLRWFESQL